jgi:hypothetical protein
MTHPIPAFITVNGIMLNAADVQMARTSQTRDVDHVEGGTRVYFISGGHTIVPGITTEALEQRLAAAVRAAAPY